MAAKAEKTEEARVKVTEKTEKAKKAEKAEKPEKAEKAKKAKKSGKTKEDILAEVVKDIRDKFGEGAIMRLGDAPRSAVEVIPSGILPLNIALGIGGYPRGRLVEIFGPEGSGKTTIALCAIAEAQKAGGTAAFIDAEHALDPHLASVLGVDTDALYLSQPDSGEQAFYIIDSLVKSTAVDIIVVDSVAALVPQAEIDGRIGESQMGLQARLMSYSLRRIASVVAKTGSIIIFINQLRASIQTGYTSGPTETTTGGRALKFYTSVRLEVKRGKKIDRGDVTIGHELYLKVVKNKLAPPFRTAHASLIYGKGIPMGVAVVDMAIDYNVINKRGSWLAYKGETLGQGKEAVAAFLSENPALQDEIINEIMAEVSRGLGMSGDVSGESDAEGADSIDFEAVDEAETDEGLEGSEDAEDSEDAEEVEAADNGAEILDLDDRPDI